MEDGIIKTSCGLCHAGCGMLAHIEDGSIVKIDGDKEHPISKGYLCKKAFAIPEMLSSPQRLTKPLKKMGDKQVEISWEEAFDLAAEKIRECVEAHGPEFVMRCSGAPVNYDARDGLNALMNAIGSGSATGSASQCSLPRSLGRTAVAGVKGEPDFERAKLIVLWGANPLASHRLGGFCGYERIHELVDRAVKRGSRVVCIDPVKSETAERCIEWVAVKCGTDAALGLAIISHIIDKELYDKEFVEGYCLGFTELAQHVKNLTPEWAAPICGVPAAEIRRLAEMIASIRPAAICDGNGLDQYCNTVDSARVVTIISALTGNLEVPGGTVTLPFIPQAKVNKSRKACLRDRFPLFRETPFIELKDALICGDENAPKVLLVHHANPVLIHANPERSKKALSKLDFLMTVDIFPTATTELSDLVLPAASYFEHYAYRAFSGFEEKCACFSRPIAEAPDGVKNVFEIEYEIAKRLGIADKMPYCDDRSWMNFMLAPAGINFGDMAAKQYIGVKQSDVHFSYLREGFGTPSGKVELYSEAFKEAGLEPMPVYREPAGMKLDSNAYPMLATSLRPGDFVHTKLHNSTYLTDTRRMPEIWISAVDAAKIGLHDGDVARASSERGSGDFTVKIKKEQVEGLVAIEFGWGNPTDCGADMNALISDECFDPASGGTPNRLFACRIEAK